MKRKALIIGALLAVLSIGLVQDADAHRKGYHRGHRHHYRPHHVWVAPPPPPVIVIGPVYRPHYHHRPHYVRPRHHHGYYNGSYAYRGPNRHW